MDPKNPNSFTPTDHAIRARMLVAQYINRTLKTPNNVLVEMDDVYVVSFTFVLGSWKALVSTTIPDSMYYEVTYNRPKGETYLDAYRKFDNMCIPDRT